MKNLFAALAVAGAALLAACAALNRPIPGQDSGILFFSDLGPNAIDVSSYPAVQRRNYKVYARVCSQCHSLARSINSPLVSRDFWQMYIMAMKRRSDYAPTQPITAAEEDEILAFLDYDSRVRKVERAKEFEAQTRALKRRFAALESESSH